MYNLEDFQFHTKNIKNSTIDLTAFTYVPDINEAMQQDIRECVRKFNNNCLCLFDFYQTLNEYYNIVIKEQWDSYNNRRYRQFISLVYKELYVYQDKILVFVSFILHIKKHLVSDTQKCFKEISKYKDTFPIINEIISKIDEIRENEEYKRFQIIRNNEVHYEYEVDSVNLNLRQENDLLILEAVSYVKDINYFKDNLDAVIKLLLDLKNIVQKLINTNEIFKINQVCKITKD